MLTGTINRIPRFTADKKPRYFNFIKHDGKSYFFHVSQFLGEWPELVKAITDKGEVEVTFEIDEEASTKEQPKAKNVKLIV